MPTKTYKIYKCINIINGKIYIGFTNKQFNTRITEHHSSSKAGSDHLLHKAIRKYGKENFEWEVIYESLDREHTLNNMEKYFIEEYSSYFETGLGYNMTYGGQGGMLGKKHSEETKQKMKEARKISKYRIRNPTGIGLNPIKAAESRRGKSSWNAGKKLPHMTGANNVGGNFTRGKTWVKDSITGKRIWI